MAGLPHNVGKVARSVGWGAGQMGRPNRRMGKEGRQAEAAREVAQRFVV
jgi:hypothetical protein